MDFLTVYNASTLEPLQTLNLDGPDEVEVMLAGAADLHRKGPLPVPERLAILGKTAELLSERHEDYSMLIAEEGGKPLTDARAETTRAINGIENAMEVLRTESGREIPMGLNAASAGRLAFTTKEPLGPVVAVSAFNHPLNLIVHQVVPAVATGCPVIVKPAPTTPISCMNFVKLMREAGLPEGWCQVALTDNAVAEKLVTDSRVAFFSFIGSAKVGWMLRSKLAPGARCALEHGGAAPVIIERDADLEQTLPALLKGAYYHAGQVCVSVQRLFVHADIVEEFTSRWVTAVEGLKTGDATLAETEVGPLILPREVDRVTEWVDEAREAGAEILTGGEKLGPAHYAPTVIANAPADSRVNTLEIFGPVSTIQSFTDPDKALAQANGLDVAFQASVLSQDIDRALYYAKRLDASAVMVNDHTAFRVDWMPFAGRRTSGLGIGGIPYTMHDMTQDKMIVLKSPSL